MMKIILCAIISTFALVTRVFSASYLDIGDGSGYKVLQQGATFQFTANLPVTWSLAPGSLGTIDPDGTFHAPAKIAAKQSLGGCQILPNNHIFNTRIDSLPVHAQSEAWITSASVGHPHYAPGTPLNITTSASPSTNMVFAYTPDNNGPFKFLSYPDRKMQGGYFALPFIGVDRHIVSVEKDSCMMQDVYNFYNVGDNTINPCLSCNSQSGVRYANSTYNLPTNGGTDAASMYLLPLMLRSEEIEAGAINHALRFTIAHPDQDYIWPALSSAYYGRVAGRMQMGARVRLKSTFNDSGFSSTAKVLTTQLKQYGLILADAGGNWDIDVLLSNFSPAATAAFAELYAGIVPTDFEVVDESSLMISATSGDTATGATTVIADDGQGHTAQVRVVLTGVTIGVQSSEETIQAGSAAKQLTAWVNGSTNSGVIWSMSPSVGTLTTGGIYTAPASVSEPTVTTLTATSSADQDITAKIKVTILPVGILRINAGSASSYTDFQGNTWLPDVGMEATHWWDNSNLFPVDGALYGTRNNQYGDLRYNLTVPNGNYKITAKFGSDGLTATKQLTMNLESQGQVVYRNVDLYAANGGANRPIDFELPAVVNDGKLYYASRFVCCAGGSSRVSALQIEPDASAPHITVTPSNGGTVNVLQTFQFYAVGWFMGSSVTWTISPQVGSIDANGLYTAPSIPLVQNTAVTVTATSTEDPSKTATASLTVTAGVPAIRVNCGPDAGVTDVQGNVWSADYGFTGGVTFDGLDAMIAGAPGGQQLIYQSSRYGYGNDGFHYSFAVPNATYQVTLKWAEYRTVSAGYDMDVLINGTKVLSHFDPVNAAGGVRVAHDRTFTTVVTNNAIRIDFNGYGTYYLGAAINGIEIVSGTNSHRSKRLQAKLSGKAR